MKRDQTPEQREPTDSNLDIPSEANREKHINFLDTEANDNRSEKDSIKDFAEERRKEWEQGIEEGKQARNDNSE